MYLHSRQLVRAIENVKSCGPFIHDIGYLMKFVYVM